jgi:hypothetical protein
MCFEIELFAELLSTLLATKFHYALVDLHVLVEVAKLAKCLATSFLFAFVRSFICMGS